RGLTDLSRGRARDLPAARRPPRSPRAPRPARAPARLRGLRPLLPQPARPARGTALVRERAAAELARALLGHTVGFCPGGASVWQRAIRACTSSPAQSSPLSTGRRSGGGVLLCVLSLSDG